ncbi:MAG TPA: FAD-dependent oxidoreductase [Aquabacterium sp.]|uniref:NAD(P)/FAD-dependent oxidoreductase n=1 Tax=Aquabacterium sp. TaxID=1872578 RepID=UPI002E34AA39|nr:FAD-dependent oxidoreductase [Aquabacterium sp.]HEX5355851.1 FAD-dependent oxidoreductase [Aquabacterium sp.]
MKRIAVIGAGIAGLGAAWRLATAPGERQVTLFEAGAHFGGHANTVDVTLPDAQGRLVTHGVDTGFLVFNERTYPHLIRLFAQLNVPVAKSDMSFSVQVPERATQLAGLRPGLQWCGSDLNTVFAQRRNLLSPAFWGMLADLMRFNRVTTDLALRGSESQLREPIADFLARHRFGDAFREGYLLPMVACIWSCPVQQMMRFPIATLIRFCHNHGLLQVTNRPQWFTVAGGSREYVQRLLAALPDVRLNTPVSSLIPLGDAGHAGVMVHTEAGSERFDDVVLATHSDQALAMLGAGATEGERSVLGAIRYHGNRAVLHTDASLLPSNKRAWAAWNYERAAHPDQEDRAVCLHYLINKLQPVPWAQPVVVSLNPLREPAPDQVLGTFDYAHPVFDQAAIEAQGRLHTVQGRRHIWFAGAWAGYGFHEDGLKSGLAAASGLLARDGVLLPDDAADLASDYLHAHGGHVPQEKAA